MLALCLVLGAVRAQAAAGIDALKLFARAVHVITTEYVDEVDLTHVIDGAIRGLVQALDPYSVYLTPRDRARFNEDVAGRFGGIGVEVTVESGWITVTSVTKGGPAHRAGLVRGERIVAIDGVNVRFAALDETLNMVRGTPGTLLRLAVAPPERGEEPNETEAELSDALGAALESRVRIVDIYREIVDVAPVEARLLPERIGYLRVHVFSSQSERKALDSLADLEHRVAPLRMRALIIDLRDNPGGLLDEAAYLAEYFVGKRVIVRTRGRERDEVTYRGASEAHLADTELVLLVDEGTASAAEVFMGALQDAGRAIVLGRRTYGKGTVQSIIDLPYGRALKLTTARYVTPAGRDVHGTGLAPDVELRAGNGYSEPAVGTRDDLVQRVKHANESPVATILAGDSDLERTYRFARAAR